MRASLYARRGKRLLDAAAAAAGLILLSPLLLAIAAAIKVLDPGPVLFRQTRVGKGFRPFAIVKFRSMRAGGRGPDITAARDARVTPLGRFLRRTKLDELPQLLNVLRGEMSLVGPRPEVPKYVALFRKEYEQILTVKPGISDYAALAYRDEESLLAGCPDPEQAYVGRILPDKISHYRRYIAEQGLLTDLKILWATLSRVAG